MNCPRSLRFPSKSSHQEPWLYNVHAATCPQALTGLGHSDWNGTCIRPADIHVQSKTIQSKPCNANGHFTFAKAEHTTFNSWCSSFLRLLWFHHHLKTFANNPSFVPYTPKKCWLRLSWCSIWVVNSIANRWLLQPVHRISNMMHGLVCYVQIHINQPSNVFVQG